ncbi:MAG: TIGR02444 family protein [Pseudomonadales bacterium]|nr:TIGR02444 family protein [Pseudomonadales bacterium]MCP5329663.1 TIGR02444 family protein [Pseudomonadales bacterium]MCP5343798.1 TIGR02444 family protein [Pseudomonadales bacterium]
MSAHESFWDYSCRVYALPGVSTLCLRLQNEHGQDVNMLLFAAWFAGTRGELSDALLQQALAFSQSWAGAVVRPLRGARGWLKETLEDLSPVSTLERDGMQELRTQIKALELRTEQYQQTRLEALVSDVVQALTARQQQHAMSVNLQRVAACYTQPSPALQEALSALCSALASA